jgi:very-short-patch-repair endonuclease
MESEGYRMPRFWNIDGLRNIDGVLEVIHNEIAALSESGPTPTPTPPPKGVGK